LCSLQNQIWETEGMTAIFYQKRKSCYFIFDKFEKVVYVGSHTVSEIEGWFSYFFTWERWIVFTILVSMFQSSPLDFSVKILQSTKLFVNYQYGRIVWDYGSLAWVLDLTINIIWYDGSENVLAIKEPYLVLLHWSSKNSSLI